MSDSSGESPNAELQRIQRELARAVRDCSIAEELAARSEARAKRTNADLIAENDQLRKVNQTIRLIAKAEAYLEIAALVERGEATASVLRDHATGLTVSDDVWARSELGDAFLTVDDVARLFGVKAATVKAWARSGQIPAVGVGDGRKVWAFHCGTLEAWANAKSEENLDR